jgi:hypothetical protein
MFQTGGEPRSSKWSRAKIAFRGRSIEELIESQSFTDMIWLMVMGFPASKAQARLLDAALVASVDHGPQAPSYCRKPHGDDLRCRNQ